MAKTPKNTHIEFKKQGQETTALILDNRGLTWFVRDDKTGEEYQVQKKSVLRQWVEDPAEVDPDEDGIKEREGASLMEALGELGKSGASDPQPTRTEARAAAPETPENPNLVTLKQVCFDLKVEPRIARRRLRKAVGQVGTGNRWEWDKTSDAYAAVLAVLTNNSAE